MKKTTQIAITAILSLAIVPLFSQDLHIHYDAQTEAVKYLFDGEEIQKPKVKKGANVFLHIDNYNNYLYDVEVAVDDKVIQSTGNAQAVLSMLSPSGMSGMSISGFMDGFDSGVSDDYANFENTEYDGPGFGAASAEWAQVATLKQKFDAAAVEMVKTEKRLQAIQAGIQEYKDAQEIKHLVVQEVNKIKYNPAFTPEQIKKLSKAYLEKGLEVGSVQEINLDQLLERNNQKKHLSKKLSLLDQAEKDYMTQTKTMAGLSVLLSDISLADVEFNQFKGTVDQVYEKAKVVEDNVKMQKEELQLLLQEAQTGNLNTLTAMHYEYEALANNDFSHTYRTEAVGDLTTLDVTFTRKDSLEFTKAKKEIKVAPIRVPVFGGIKVSTSVGLGFGQYFKRPQSYFVRNGEVIGENEDSFYPIISSFFHFYAQSPGNVNLGGAFGIGVPLNGADGFQSAVFFLGPTLIIGKEQRFAFTGGIMGGKVQRLAQGYEVGQTVGAEVAAVPVHYPYELGLFLGLTFNLGGR